MAVPLSTIKSALKIEYDDDDTDLIRLRDAAWSLIERETGLAMSVATRSQYLARFDDTAIAFLPFNSVTAVTYTDPDGSTVTMDSALWWTDLSDGPAPILRFNDRPAIKVGTNIVVSVSSGYDAIPNELTHAIIALVGGWYNNPEAFQPVGLNAVPMSVEYIISSFRVRSFLR